MFLGFWRSAKANKESILYTILTIFLLERVRRGWNRIEQKGKTSNLDAPTIEKKQHTFMFGAAVLYALPLLFPMVKYMYRSMNELSQYVNGLSTLSNVWVFAIVVLLTEAFLAIVIYNLLGIYVERMNAALGFFRSLGRSVIDGSRVAVQASSNAGMRLATNVKHATTGTLSRGRSFVGTSFSTLGEVKRLPAHLVPLGGRAIAKSREMAARAVSFRRRRELPTITPSSRKVA